MPRKMITRSSGACVRRQGRGTCARSGRPPRMVERGRAGVQPFVDHPVPVAEPTPAGRPASGSREGTGPAVPGGSPTCWSRRSRGSPARPSSGENSPVETVRIDSRFRGPDTSGNGGYVAGVVASLLAGPAEVTLRLPPPLDRELGVRRDGGVSIWDGDALVAEGVAVELELDVPAAPTLAEAEAARLPHGDLESPFPQCFVCRAGSSRWVADLPGPVAGRELSAAPWQPAEVSPELVWAAIDCTGAYGSGAIGRGTVVLGRMAARVDELPRVGEPCVVAGLAARRGRPEGPRRHRALRRRRPCPRLRPPDVARPARVTAKPRQRWRRIAFRSRSRISSARRIRSSMSSCSAWR